MEDAVGHREDLILSPMSHSSHPVSVCVNGEKQLQNDAAAKPPKSLSSSQSTHNMHQNSTEEHMHTLSLKGPPTITSLVYSNYSVATDSGELTPMSKPDREYQSLMDRICFIQNSSTRITNTTLPFLVSKNKVRRRKQLLPDLKGPSIRSEIPAVGVPDYPAKRKKASNDQCDDITAPNLSAIVEQKIRKEANGSSAGGNQPVSADFMNLDEEFTESNSSSSFSFNKSMQPVKSSVKKKRQNSTKVYNPRKPRKPNSVSQRKKPSKPCRSTRTGIQSVQKSQVQSLVFNKGQLLSLINKSPKDTCPFEESSSTITDLLSSFQDAFNNGLNPYNLRKHNVTSIYKDKHCQYTKNYVCTRTTATPSSPYCLDHYRLMGDKPNAPTPPPEVKSLPICNFVFKQGAKQTKCQKQVFKSDPRLKYCKNHYDDIQEMKTKLFPKQPVGHDYLHVYRHGLFEQNNQNIDFPIERDNCQEDSYESEDYDYESEDYDHGEMDLKEVWRSCVGDDVEIIEHKSNAKRNLIAISSEKFHAPQFVQNNNNNEKGDPSVDVCAEKTPMSFQWGLDEDSDDGEDLEDYELLSTAGYHTVDEILRILRDKLKALLTCYRKRKEFSKDLYLIRRQVYLHELEAHKTHNEQEECSNPDMLPSGVQFPAEFIANELLDRANVQSLMRLARIKGKIGLLIFKAKKRKMQIFASGDSHEEIPSGITAMEQNPLPSRDMENPCVDNPEKIPTSSSSKINNSSGKIANEKCGGTTKLLSEETNQASKVKVNSCAVFSCSEKAIPLSEFCLQHITKDKKQRLYTLCKNLPDAMSTSCETPVAILMENKGCPAHFQFWFPDLRLSDEEKEWIEEQERNQVVLPQDEGDEAVDKILASQFYDMCHLENELSAALNSDYLDTQSESDESENETEKMYGLPSPTEKT